jgi:hypothetical protein
MLGKIDDNRLVMKVIINKASSCMYVKQYLAFIGELSAQVTVLFHLPHVQTALLK